MMVTARRGMALKALKAMKMRSSEIKSRKTLNNVEKVNLGKKKNWEKKIIWLEKCKS